jgi:hypothetical protein
VSGAGAEPAKPSGGGVVLAKPIGAGAGLAKLSGGGAWLKSLGGLERANGLGDRKDPCVSMEGEVNVRDGLQLGLRLVNFTHLMNKLMLFPFRDESTA